MAIASLRGLSFRYPGGPRPALAGVELDLEAGLTLIGGPSGGGKSTLLRVLDGLVPHFHGGRVSGGAQVAGLDVLRTPASRLARQAGLVFQDPELQIFRATVERDVAFGLENAGEPRSGMPERVREALRAAGAEHLWGRRTATLSGGERQRVAIAGVLALRPRLIALDEPLSQLDGEGRAALARKLRELADEGRAVVVAEQRMEALAGVADRELAVEAGRLRSGQPPRAALPLRTRHGLGPACWRFDAVSAGHGEPLLTGLSLEGRAGEVIAFVGANGSGKTTLLRTLAGLLPPLSGRVHRPAGRTAYLPQHPAAILHRPTLRAEVELTLGRSGRDLEEAGRLLAELGLAELAERYPRDLSGGERQRAAIAAVVAGGPALVLLDEPTRGMDPGSLERLAGLVDRLAAEGTSVVLATHELELAAALADRVVELPACA